MGGLPERKPGPELSRLPDGRMAQLWQGGAADGPPVFFWHGCPDPRLAARSGERAAERVGVRLVAVNRPGYGRSDPHESGHLSVADDTVAVADLLGIDRFALLGMSVGGPYALACAVRHPRRVTAIGLVASPGNVPRMTPPWHRDDLAPDRQAFVQRLATSSVPDAVALLRPEFEQYVAQVAPDDPDDAALAGRWTTGLPPPDEPLMRALPRAHLAAAAREALAHPDGYLRDAALTFRRWEFRPELVTCPTTLWYGELDPNAPPRNGRWIAEHVPGARLVVRAGTAHAGALMLHWDDILSTLVTAGRP